MPRFAKNYLILIFSLFFYAWGATDFIGILLVASIANFYIVRLMHAAVTNRRRYLLASTVLNLGLLLYFKYANFFVGNFNAALHSMGIHEVGWTKIALPIGISFYTFQTITYAVDVYRKENEPLRKLTDYLLYILSFPQMIAGPIVRYGTVAKDITSRKEVIDDKLLGFYRFSIGLAKKVLIANYLGKQADLIFDANVSGVDGAEAWVGILAYTFQIYFDFAGYSDMAIGMGRMIGFKFPENFDSPYTSRSITEFWRRWHITLGNFMRDYLYIPLGGNKNSWKNRVYVNLTVVFLISGFWHGASWNYVLWGAFHGIFLVLDRLFLKKFLDRIGPFAIVITFFVVMMGWVFFRIENVDHLFAYFGKLFAAPWKEVQVIPQFWLPFIVAALFSFITLFGFGKKLGYFFFEKERFSLVQHGILTLSLGFLFYISVSAVISSGFNPFIYYRF
ncbi:MBOAT family protein [Crocinitomicaceae bacterium]|nr:MBOAT family protein [Crocinitomicaceae bacterium]